MHFPTVSPSKFVATVKKVVSINRFKTQQPKPSAEEPNNQLVLAPLDEQRRTAKANAEIDEFVKGVFSRGRDDSAFAPVLRDTAGLRTVKSATVHEGE